MAKKTEPAVVVVREKQYIVLQNFRSGKIRWKKMTMIRMIPDEAVPYVGAGIITPINTAINDGVWPPEKKTLATTMKAATAAKKKPTKKETKKSTKPTDKKLLENSLQAKVQAAKKEAKKDEPKDEPKKDEPEKEESKEELKKTTLSADKLAAIKAGGKSTSSKDNKK